MTQPSKVIGFLDFAGAWDASLAFVMIGAIGVYFVAYPAHSKDARAITGGAVLDSRNAPILTRQLILGAVDLRRRMGAEWILPRARQSPSLASGALPVVAFVASMAAGIYLHARWQSRSRPRAVALAIASADS